MQFQLNGNGEIPLGISDSKLPQERFKDRTDVNNLCDDMIASDRKRNLLRANVEKIWEAIRSIPRRGSRRNINRGERGSIIARSKG